MILSRSARTSWTGRKNERRRFASYRFDVCHAEPRNSNNIDRMEHDAHRTSGHRQSRILRGVVQSTAPAKAMHRHIRCVHDGDQTRRVEMQRPRRDRIHASVVQAMCVLRISKGSHTRRCVGALTHGCQIYLGEISPHAIIRERWTPIATYDKIKRRTFIVRS